MKAKNFSEILVPTYVPDHTASHPRRRRLHSVLVYDVHKNSHYERLTDGIVVPSRSSARYMKIIGSYYVQNMKARKAYSSEQVSIEIPVRFAQLRAYISLGRIQKRKPYTNLSEHENPTSYKIQ
jgi:hypothetical protein